MAGAVGLGVAAVSVGPSDGSIVARDRAASQGDASSYVPPSEFTDKS